MVYIELFMKIFMNFKNSKTSERHRLLLNLLDKKEK